MDPAQAKQQIAERVKQANKFLVTVNSNPTVDQLAACIGLTLMLNKMGKHATAVFSGKVPSTIQFLQPDKTLQKNTDSLQDFIISLDKNKADKLRYKVEDDVVRIFITPYRTSLSEKDLVFSQGDFNVEAVVALGVNQRTQLDNAITTHGRILHDATVISVNAGVGKAPDIGQINWADPQASSLCEMLVSISEAFGTGLIDSQMATAFLTGIVAETERFSNKKTSPKVMTMSAQLMAAGANQQLISEKLAPPPPPPPPPPKPPKPPAPPPKPVVPPKPKQPPLKPEGVIDVPHDDKKKAPAPGPQDMTEIHIDDKGNLITEDEIQLNKSEPKAEDKPAAPPPAAEPLPLPPHEPEEAPAPPPPPPPQPEIPQPAPAPPPAPELTLPPAEPSGPPPEISHARASNTAAPQPELKLPPATPPPPVAPAGHHAFIGNTAQPAGIGMAFSSSSPSQPDWASPYDLVPMDPLAQAGASTSEFGSTAAAVNPEESQNNFSQGHAINPPAGFSSEPTPMPMPVDQARSAVEQAIASAPFDPATGGAIQALNAIPLGSQQIHTEAPPADTNNIPAMSSSDTPMLVLPSDNQTSVTATQPIATQDAVSGVAPPPVPPPINVAPGAVVPNPTQR
ncbi:MAG TPA: hypothetical protein VFH37_03605 [Candidatus Saccharimonadales bacterium]|nr:hypothetical protein [Candidatus Saccharimonadales bacterium]